MVGKSILTVYQRGLLQIVLARRLWGALSGLTLGGDQIQQVMLNVRFSDTCMLQMESVL